MSRTRKTLVIITGTILLLIVLFFIVLATFDWNRLKPTINQKVSAELNRPFAIRGDLGVVWERQPDERGWRSWIPWPHVHAEDIVLGNPPAIPQVTMIHLPRVEATLAPLALLSKTVYLPWIKLEQPDVRLIRLAEDNNNWTFQLAGDKRTSGDSAPSSWSFRLDNILFDRGTIAIDDKITRSDITILVDPLGKPLPFSEVTGTKDRHSAAKPGDYVFGLSLKGRYKGQPVTGNGKIGGMLALRSASAPFPLQGDFHSGNTRVAFSGTVSDPLNVGGIDLRLKFAGDSLRDLYDLTGVLLPADRFETDKWQVMDADVRFKGRRIEHGGTLPISDLSTHVILEDGDLRLQPVRFGLANGSIAGSVHLQGDKKPLQGEANLQARRLKLKALMPNVEMMQKTLGEMNGDVQLRGSGNSVAALLGNSNGNLKLLMNDGLISRNLMEILGLNVGNYLIGQIFGDEEVRVNCAAANIDVTNGVARPQIFAFDTENALINVTGTASFASEQLDLTIDPESKGFRVITLRSPLYVRGTFKSPQAGVKAGPLIVRGAVAAALATLVTPAAALLALISPAEGDSNQCRTILSQMKK
ncbi:AsmA family protein [Klebsiella pneumoniae]|nr:AsmA family protein [Klebsiella pneumoniae]